MTEREVYRGSMRTHESGDVERLPQHPLGSFAAANWNADGPGPSCVGYLERHILQDDE